jgi:transcriptional regulator with XRE-family HTH domain
MSQQVFAMKCGIPLRTYKRLEQGQCDSLQVFLQVVIAFDRTIALELLFPPQQMPETALDRIRRRANEVG